jgi:starch synthase
MPSRFEPCGLSQMYAQRLASLPIGRKTGGLAETIKDGQTGFLFSEPSAASLLGAVCRAFQTFGHKRHLNLMRLEAMAQPFEWRSPAGAYRSLYGAVTAA